MTRNFGVLAPAFMVLAFVGYACTQGEVVEGPAVSGAAGSTNPGTAGTTGAGNVVGSAGTTGQAGRGGTTGQAGNTSRGGTTGQAGNTSRGGTTGQAGSNPAGTGGSNPAGTGGSSPAGTGGSSSSACGSTTFAVSADGFVQMPVSGGCWSGYPFTYQDAYGTMVMPAPMSTGGFPMMLRMTGTIAAVSGMMYSYAGMGFNLGQTPAGGTANPPVTPKGSGLTFNFTNTTTGAGVILRAQIKNDTMTWCTNITASPASVPYSSFTIDCYNTPPGAAYAKQPINQIQMNLAGGTGAGTIGVTLTSVTEMP